MRIIALMPHEREYIYFLRGLAKRDPESAVLSYLSICSATPRLIQEELMMDKRTLRKVLRKLVKEGKVCFDEINPIPHSRIYFRCR